MKVTALVFALSALAACQNDTRALNERLDKMDKKLDALMQQRPGTGAPARPQPPAPDRAKTYAMPIAGDPTFGAADAKVTLIEAYDYACPYCERARATLDELAKKYGNDLRIVKKELVVHPQVATTGALAFCAADKQGKGAQMDDLLWDKQFKVRAFDADQCWAAGTCDKTYSLASELGLDLGKFKDDMKSCQDHVQSDGKDLRTFGVAATPAFFINGRFISGAAPMDSFSAVIDDEMKKASDRIAQGTPAADYYQKWILDQGLKGLEPAKP